MEEYGFAPNSAEPVGGNKVAASKSGDEAFSHVFKDADQMAKYDAIVELLLAAGYFRARISGLSHFDKVIGGLTWCISSSQVDVDIDLFFQEDSNMGVKIQLGEVIEKTLARMKCPHQLRSYQIRGLDFINILPVIQWLVTKVIEVRKETGDLLRTVSEWQFGKKYALPSDKEFEARKETAAKYASGLLYRYRPSRKLRNKGGSFREEEDKVQATLLEYGHKAYREVRVEKKLNKSNSKAAAAIAASLGGGGGGDDEDAARVSREEDERKFQKMLTTMETTVGRSDSVSNNVLATLMANQSADISRWETNLEGIGTTTSTGVSGKQFEEEQHKRRLENLQKQIEALNAKLLSQREPHHTLASELQTVENEYTEKAGRNQHIVTSLETFDSMVTDENRDVIETLRALVILNESLKKQEEQFRLNCKRQLLALNEKLKGVQSVEVGSLETDRDKVIRETHERDLKRLIENRQGLGKKIRDIAMVERKIDEIPSRSELQQYQLQFVELYEQVAAKLTETRKYYQNYNTLNSALTYLTKEISLINSINENYKLAMKSKKNKDNFIEQLENIVSIANENLKKTEQKIADEKRVLHNLNCEYQNLITKERAYHKAVKEFEVECAKNEKLLAQIAS